MKRIKKENEKKIMDLIEKAGRVKYDTNKEKFIPCPSIRADYPLLKSKLLMDGKLIYRFDQDTGILEIGNEELAE